MQGESGYADPTRKRESKNVRYPKAKVRFGQKLAKVVFMKANSSSRRGPASGMEQSSA